MSVKAGQAQAAAHKRLTAVFATAAAIVGLATGVLTLRDQLFPRSDLPADQGTSSPEGMVTAATAAQLSDDVQLGRFVQLLGAPASQNRLQNDEWLVSTWESPDIAVNAFSNRDSQVVAFTLTSLGPGFTPLVEHVRGGIRLRSSVFADVRDDPAGIAGNYPPNGAYSYEEFYLGGGATQGKSVVLAASYAANADDATTTALLQLNDCLPFSVFEEGRGCSPDRLQILRSGLHVTSMTVGERPALEALASDGAVFFPQR
jgi:hypothetical protein